MVYSTRRTFVCLIVLACFISSLLFMYGLPSNIKKRELGLQTNKANEKHNVPQEKSEDTMVQFSLDSSNPTLIFYNRVPKTGSTSLKRLFYTSALRNGWTLVSSKTFDRFVLNYTMQKNLVEKLISMKNISRVVFERHVHWINFTRFNANMPIYINVIRDPLERMISSYYFLRHHLKHIYRNVTQESFDACVNLRKAECTGDTYKGYFSVIPFFCGQHQDCRKDSDFALNMAKGNLLQHYAVVGLTEDLHNFTRVLEHKFPSYFQGLTRLLNTNDESLKIRSRTREKIQPKEITIEIMKKKMWREFDFYFWVKHLFHNSVQKLDSFTLD